MDNFVVDCVAQVWDGRLVMLPTPPGMCGRGTSTTLTNSLLIAVEIVICCLMSQCALGNSCVHRNRIR